MDFEEARSCSHRMPAHVTGNQDHVLPCLTCENVVGPVVAVRAAFASPLLKACGSCMMSVIGNRQAILALSNIQQHIRSMQPLGVKR